MRNCLLNFDPMPQPPKETGDKDRGAPGGRIGVCETRVRRAPDPDGKAPPAAVVLPCVCSPLFRIPSRAMLTEAEALFDKRADWCRCRGT